MCGATTGKADDSILINEAIIYGSLPTMVPPVDIFITTQYNAIQYKNV